MNINIWFCPRPKATAQRYPKPKPTQEQIEAAKKRIEKELGNAGD